MQLIYNIAGGVTEVSSRDGNDESLRVMKLLCGQNNFEGELGAYSEHDDASFHSLPEICFDGQKSAMKKTSNMAQVRDDNHLPDSEASRLVPHSKGRNYQAERDPIGGTASDPPVQEPEEDIPSNRSSKPTKRKTTARKGRSKQKRSKATDLDTDAEDDDFSQQYPHAKLTISEKKNPIRTAYKLSHYLALKEHELAKAEENVKLTLEAMNTQKLVDDLKIKNSRIEIEVSDSILYP